MAQYQFNIMQNGDALDLQRSLTTSCTPLVIFDPQYRGVLDRLDYGNEGARQRGRFKLPAMEDHALLARKRDHGRADAALIALTGAPR